MNNGLEKHYKQSTGTAAITAKKDGRYEYCFSNVMSTVADKIVRHVPYYNVYITRRYSNINPSSFNVHGVLYIADDENMAPLEKEVRNLVQGLQAVKDEQEYIVVRERVHRNTAESTNDRVKWWSIGQTVMLFAVCAWQVWYLKVCCIVCRERVNTDGALCFAVVLRGQACYLSA